MVRFEAHHEHEYERLFRKRGRRSARGEGSSVHDAVHRPASSCNHAIIVRALLSLLELTVARGRAGVVVQIAPATMSNVDV